MLGLQQQTLRIQLVNLKWLQTKNIQININTFMSVDWIHNANISWVFSSRCNDTIYLRLPWMQRSLQIHVLLAAMALPHQKPWCTGCDPQPPPPWSFLLLRDSVKVHLRLASSAVLAPRSTANMCPFSFGGGENNFSEVNKQILLRTAGEFPYLPALLLHFFRTWSQNYNSGAHCCHLSSSSINALITLSRVNIEFSANI